MNKPALPIDPARRGWWESQIEAWINARVAEGSS